MGEIVSIGSAIADREATCCDTPTLRQMHRMMAATQADPSVGISWITGDAGVGKTTAARQYAENNPGVCYVCLAPGETSVKAVLGQICAAILKRWPARPVAAFWDLVRELQAIADDLSDRSEDDGTYLYPLLMIDEIQRAPNTTLDFLRGLHDAANGDRLTLAMLWLGNDEARAQLYREGDKAFAPIFSRRGLVHDFEHPSFEDLACFCRHQGVERAELIRFLEPISRSEGLRGVNKAIAGGKNIAAAGSTPLALKHLKAAIMARPTSAERARGRAT